MHDDESRLLAVFRLLTASGRQALQAYAEALAQRRGASAARADIDAAGLRPEPRPDGESVVMAIKRLTRTYPMLDRRKLIGQASRLMAEHALQGREAAVVIDELEVVFERHYLDTVEHER